MKKNVIFSALCAFLALCLCVLCACGSANDNSSAVSRAESAAESRADAESEAESAAGPVSDEFSVTLFGDSYALMTLGTVEGTEYTVPSQFGGYPVTELGSAVFSGHTELTAINIPEGIRHTNGFTFAGCTGLTSITLPGTLDAVAGGDFMDCTSLVSAVLGDGIGLICASAFAGCSSLERIEIPVTVETIESYAFSRCASLNEISYAGTAYEWQSVEKQDEWFDEDASPFTVRCSDGEFVYPEPEPETTPDECFGFELLEDGTYMIYTDGSFSHPPVLVLPSEHEGKKVTVVGRFTGCGDVTRVVIPEGVTKISEEAFFQCSSLESVFVPKSVNVIFDRAFYDCSSLANVVLSEGVKRIGSSAFEGCRSLKSIGLPQSLSDMGSGAFRSCTGLKSITLPENIVRIEKSAFEYCNALEKVVIQGDVYGIYQYAFRGCGSLTEFTFPETLTEIGELAFLGVPFSSLDLPASLTKIGKSAFYHCNSLTSVTIPDNVADIGANVFEGCGSLAAVTLSENIKSIPSGAFTGCTALDDVWYGGTVAQWNKTEKGENWNKDTGGCTVHCSDGDVYADDGTLYYPEGVAEATPESYFVFTLTNDGTYSIKAKDVNDLPETVVIPAFYEGAEVTRVAYNGFYGCSGLKKVVVPSTVRSIQSEAFANCFYLGELVLTDRSTSLFYNSLYQTALYYDNSNWENDAFYLDDILIMAARGAGGAFDIRYGTKYISGGAFNNCKWYTSVNIPDTVVSIGDSAFYGCASLESITVPEGVETIGVAAFQSTALQRVYLPSTLKKLGENAFALNDHLKDFYYAGTKEQWQNLEKGKGWNDRVYFFDVHCSDGDVHYDY